MNATPHIHIPPEWELQSAVWVGWPTLPEEWGEAFAPAREEIACFVETLSQHVDVTLVAGSHEAEASAKIACAPYARIIQLPLGDIWLRDTGPILAKTSGTPSALCFNFDGWGRKYVMPGDTETSEAIADTLGVPILRTDVTLEGGAIEMDGSGHLITTRQCLLDGIRNPDWDEGAAEKFLTVWLGAKTITWLDRGLTNDHTDGHVDNIARFIGPGRAICQMPSGKDDPNHDVLVQIEGALIASGVIVETLPSPGRIEQNGVPMPASHLNFLITNGVVIMPSFEQVYAPRAAEKLQEVFPDRQILTLPANNILAGGGTFHCMTREIPNFVTQEISR